MAAFYTKRAVADLLGVSTRTVDRMVVRGLLPLPAKFSAAQSAASRFPIDATDAAIEALKGAGEAPRTAADDAGVAA